LRALFALFLTVTACGDNLGRNAYMWDDRRVLCSEKVDDLNGGLDWESVEQHLQDAEEGGWAVIFHAHTPTVTVSLDRIERLLSAAATHHLAPVTFRDLDEASPRGAAFALAFDDNAPDEWMLARPLLERYQARVTFFVARYAALTTTQQDEIRVLADDGHDIEPHTVNHLHPRDYVAAHGLDAYVADEVLPSFQVLIDAGFPPPSAFAYPFGEHTAELDTAILAHVPRVRTTMGECPW